MPQNKINVLDKKVPFNLSVRRVIKIEVEKKCDEFSIDKNAVAESLFSQWLESFKKESNNK